MSVRLGELLTKASLISPDQLKEALKLQKETGGKLGETLIKLGFVAEEDITECLSQQFGVPSINLAHFEIDSSVIKLIPADVARKYNISRSTRPSYRSPSPWPIRRTSSPWTTSSS
jgi:type IV pilus assembly protein PilB